MLITPTRRTLVTGLASLVAAPAIVRISSLMPVKVVDPMDEVYAVTRRNMNDLLYGDNHAELVAVTRRAFRPRFFLDVDSGILLASWDAVADVSARKTRV